jgi:hypothetical protein
MVLQYVKQPSIVGTEMFEASGLGSTFGFATVELRKVG